MRDPADDDDHYEPVHCHHCDACRRVWLGMHTSATGALWPEGHCPACERDTWWDEAFQRQARTAEQYRAEGRADERKRIAEAIEQEVADAYFPGGTTYLSGLSFAAAITRGEA
jgi:hypothetical protein